MYDVFSKKKKKKLFFFLLRVLNNFKKMMKRAITNTARSSLAGSRRTFVQTGKVYPENDGFDAKTVKVNTAEWPKEFQFYDPAGLF